MSVIDADGGCVELAAAAADAGRRARALVSSDFIDCISALQWHGRADVRHADRRAYEAGCDAGKGGRCRRK